MYLFAAAIAISLGALACWSFVRMTRSVNNLTVAVRAAIAKLDEQRVAIASLQTQVDALTAQVSAVPPDESPDIDALTDALTAAVTPPAPDAPAA